MAVDLVVGTGRSKGEPAEGDGLARPAAEVGGMPIAREVLGGAAARAVTVDMGIPAVGLAGGGLLWGTARLNSVSSNGLHGGRLWSFG